MQNVLSRTPNVVKVPSSVFVARDHIELANIGWSRSGLKEHFADLEETVEEADVAIKGVVAISSENLPIIEELGDRAFIKLGHFFALLEGQQHGEAGPLTTAYLIGNIAYVRDALKNPLVVSAGWHTGAGFWDVRVRLVEKTGCNPGYAWKQATRVLAFA
jgi:hypothetical protein